MSVALLLVTHGDIGRSMQDAAVTIIGSSPQRTQFIAVTADGQPEPLINQAIEELAQLDSGDGVLVLTDMYGSTPSNIACALQHRNVEVVAGLNLPMLMRIMNYPNLPLHRLTDKAVSGGKEGVMFFQAMSTQDATQRN
ncbi:MAG: PTS fructose transporter subunit IIA [Gammaproteobacteria bacterium]